MAVRRLTSSTRIYPRQWVAGHPQHGKAEAAASARAWQALTARELTRFQALVGIFVGISSPRVYRRSKTILDDTCGSLSRTDWHFAAKG